jgi:hypothetical protein
MLAESSAETLPRLHPSLELSVGQRVTMICLAYVPLLHILLCIGTAAIVLRSFGVAWAILAALTALYLLPPMAVALARPRATLKGSRFSVDSPEFLRWWYTAQWQVVFSRFPQLEELLRMVPGLYSSWLRLWGAKIGRIVYWSPGMSVLDRPFVEIGNRVVIGAGARLSPHLLARGQDEITELILATIIIGDDAMIGGHSLLPAGVWVAAGEQTPGGRPIAPFSRFQNGRSVRTIRFHKDINHEE